MNLLKLVLFSIFIFTIVLLLDAAVNNTEEFRCGYMALHDIDCKK